MFSTNPAALMRSSSDAGILINIALFRHGNSASGSSASHSMLAFFAPLAPSMVMVTGGVRPLKLPAVAQPRITGVVLALEEESTTRTAEPQMFIDSGCFGIDSNRALSLGT